MLCPADVWLEASEQWIPCSVCLSMTCSKKQLWLKCLPTDRSLDHATPLIFASIRRKNLCCIQLLNKPVHNRDFVLKIMSTPSSFRVKHNYSTIYLAVESLATQQSLRHRLLHLVHTHDPLRKPGPFARDDDALALCRAAFSGDLEHVRTLLDSGEADARDANEAGESAVMRATRNALATLGSDEFERALQVLDHLIEKGADPYASNSTSEESALDLVLRAKQGKTANAELDMIEARLRRHHLIYDGNGGISSVLPSEEPVEAISRWLENAAHLRASCLGKFRDPPGARRVGTYHLISEHQARMKERARTKFVEAMNYKINGANLTNSTVDHHGGAHRRNKDLAGARHRNNHIGLCIHDHSHMFKPLQDVTLDLVDRPLCHGTVKNTQQNQPHDTDPAKRRQDETTSARRGGHTVPSWGTRRKSPYDELSPSISRPRTSPSVSGTTDIVNAKCGKLARPQTASAALALQASQDTGRSSTHLSCQARASERCTSACRQFVGAAKLDRRSDVGDNSYDEHVTVRAIKQWKNQQRVACRSSVVGKVHAGLFLPIRKGRTQRRTSLSGKHNACLDSRKFRSLPRCRSVHAPSAASRLHRSYPTGNSLCRPPSLRSGPSEKGY